MKSQNSKETAYSDNGSNNIVDLGKWSSYRNIMDKIGFLEHEAQALLPHIKMLEYIGFAEPAQNISAAYEQLLQLATQYRLKLKKMETGEAPHVGKS